jgi:hypothetical protein
MLGMLELIKKRLCWRLRDAGMLEMLELIKKRLYWRLRNAGRIKRCWRCELGGGL